MLLTLRELEAAELPMITVLNKIDLLPDPGAASASLGDVFDSVAVSALTGAGLAELRAQIEEVLEVEMQQIKVLIPFERGDLVSLLHERGLIQKEEYRPDGTWLLVRIPDQLGAQLDPYIVGSSKPRAE